MGRDPRDHIRDPQCQLCPLHESAQHVCLMGDGPIPCDVMIVGEAPGAREDDTHRAFVGLAGQLLDRSLGEVGLSRREVYISNVARCRPPDNRTPTRGEVKTCVEAYFNAEYETVSPSYLLTLGNSALQGLTKRSGITKHRGREVAYRDSILLPTYHPAAILRNPRLGEEFRADLQRFGRLVRGEPSEAKPTKVTLVNSPSQLRLLRDKLMRASVISFDVETTGLEEYREDSEIVSIGFSWGEERGAVVLLSHSQAKWKDHRAVLRYLKPALEREDCKYIGHNAKFDCRWLAAKGIFTPLTFDTMLAAHMLDENRKKSLKTLSQVLLGVDAYDIGEDVRDAYNVPKARLVRYNARDTDYTLRLYNRFKPELLAEHRPARIFAKLMMPASRMLTQVERGGIYMDQRRWLEQAVAHTRRREALMTQMLERGAPEDINFNSTQQLARWLFDELDLPILAETPKGAPSTSESVLKRLCKDHEVPRLLLQYRAVTKTLNTYLMPWRYWVDTRSRIHPTYKLFGTVTGRLSSSDPNLQQVPRESDIRGILGAGPSWVFLEADLSQIELRVAAQLAGETRMLAAFARGEDLHLKTAVETTGKLPSEISKEERKKAKAVNFGFLYGMGAGKFVEYARDNYDLHVTLEEAEAVRERFFNAYPRLLAWHDRQRRLARRYGRVQSLIGRVRHLPDVWSQDKAVRAEAERQAINSPVQSLASDLVLLSALRIHDRFPTREARIVGLVHDALLMEVHPELTDHVSGVVKETMEDVVYLRRVFDAEVTVPIVSEVTLSDRWGS